MEVVSDSTNVSVLHSFLNITAYLYPYALGVCSLYKFNDSVWFDCLPIPYPSYFNKRYRNPL